MGKPKRFDIFRDNHIGFGVRWDDCGGYRKLLSFSFPFFSITIGLGKQEDEALVTVDEFFADLDVSKMGGSDDAFADG